MKTNRIILAGGSGFLGRALASALAMRGYEPVILTRSPAPFASGHGREIEWDGSTLGPWAETIDGAAAVVNLAGRNVNCRYTRANRREINDSRTNSVRVIGAAIAASKAPPKVWVQAASLAIYGDAGDRWCDESAPAGEGFPVETCRLWEDSFAAAQTPRTRGVLWRIGFALGQNGGVLSMLSTLARWFIGGTTGTGRQFISWIHVADLERMFLWAIEREDVSGVFNATSPEPVTNGEFMRELRRAVHRPWSPPAPAWTVHIGSWFLRTEAVLALTGRRCTPRRFLDLGFPFEFPTLRPALENLLGSGGLPERTAK